MEVTYKSRALEHVCTDAQEARRKYGVNMARLIHLRVEQIQMADNTEYLLRFHVGRCHALKGERAGQFAMDLVHPYRLVFERIGEVIHIVRIVEILDFVNWTTTSSGGVWYTNLGCDTHGARE